jgi:hypothetical protein
MFSFDLKMPGTKKFASKSEVRGNKYDIVNKTTGVSERTQPQSVKSGKSSYKKPNLSTSNKRYIASL